MTNEQFLKEFIERKAELYKEVQRLLKERGVSNAVRITGLKQPYLWQVKEGTKSITFRKLLDIHNQLTY